jgi:glucan phosphoethanolaminetransferase (alkaline phosphatase superfamily)
VLRALARRRTLRVALILALPAILVVLADLAMRGGRVAAFPAKYFGSYGAAILESAVLWGLLLAVASARKGVARWLAALAFVGLATFAVGTQLYFYRQYSTYLNLDATLFGTSVADSVVGQLSTDGAHFIGSVAPPLLIAIALVWVGRKLVRTPRRRAKLLSLLTPAAVIGALLIPCSYRSVQGSTPDVIYFHAIGGLLKQLTGWEERRDIRPGRRSPPRLAPVSAKPSRARNVLFVLTESVRADAACSAPSAHCPAAPFTNAAYPGRMPLRQMRATSTTTAIQLATTWSGLPPNAGRQPLHQAPLLFDYGRAAGWETAYWTSHHMLFANSRLFVEDLPTRFRCGATHLDPLADIDLGADDRLLTTRVQEQMGQLVEPFFAVAHYGNTHVPYLIDDDSAPFKPHSSSKAPEDNEAYRNRYLNGVHRQDQTVAELLIWLRQQPFGERTVVIYSSDHGEQFREHGQLGHTGSVFDVELLVPTWIDAPEATLSETEREALASHADKPVFQTDLAATMLDLMGLWDEPSWASFREAMVGQSLIRSGRVESSTVLTNCSGVWGCAFENWGIMRGFRKLHAREWDADWLCYDVRADPEERAPLPAGDCADLRAEAERHFGHLPGRGPR